MDNGIVTALGDCVEAPAIVASLEHQDRERRRVRELLRYFQPFQAPAHSEGKPRIATDTSLTAFAQLAALRLNCQRCFISLIDNTKQYIIAEATQTISLASESIYEKDDDELSFGQTVLDFQDGVCPGTIACFTSPDDSLDVTSTFIKASRSYYVMNDMSMLEGYKGRSYVSGWPHMRFYAEVPIHSPSGICIGTLCVVDNKAREGLDLKGISILGEISDAVMDHLELCVSRIQRNRAERMIQALGQFVEGHVSVRDSWMEAQVARLSAPGMRHLSVEERAEIELGSELEHLQIAGGGDLWNKAQSSQNLHHLGRSGTAPSPRKEDHIERTQLSSADSQSSHITADKTPKPTTNTRDIHCQSHSSLMGHQTKECITDISTSCSSTEAKMPGPGNSRTDMASISSDSLECVLFRAANLIREAIGLDGVVFFDPRLIDGQLLTDSTSIKEAMLKPRVAQDIGQNRHLDGVSLESPHTLSKVMSYSTNRMGNHDDHISMPETTLQVLLHQFPLGGLITLDSEGIVGADVLTSVSGEPRSTNFEDISSTATRQGSFVTDRIDLPDVDLRRVFPGVTSLMIYPFWDNVRDKCVAHCMAWTSDPARVFQRQDFTYVASFSNSIIAELSRIEVVAADKAKSTFISSISHELRSPLHGIMASIEILRDSTSEPSCHELFSTIESCGSTLLDTIDNVLAFSQASRQATKEDDKLFSTSIPDKESGPVSAVDMETLVEEVTSICLTGVQFRKTVDSSDAYRRPEQLVRGTKSSSIASEVMVICDISPGCDWLFETNGAVWKRILLNLVGNALKYTTTGFIVVTLRQGNLETDLPVDLDVPRNRSRRVITLSVKDSGKGMSKDYLAHYLFKPFYQENPLAPGTGLGLSIVSRLVHSIDGKISVVSEEDVGTEIMVEVPLRLRNDHTEVLLAEPPPLLNHQLGIFSRNAVPDPEDKHSSIRSTQSQALLNLYSTIACYATASGLITTAVDSVGSNSADILVVQDSQYRLLEPSRIVALRKPVIVLCMEPLRNHEYAFRKPTNVVLLSNPFGPRKFQRIVESCLRIRDGLLEVGASDIDNSLKRDDVVVASPQVLGQTSSVVNMPVGDGGRLGPSLLLVEDNPINLKLLVTSIHRMEYPFITATNGAEAVAAYKSSPSQIKLVFMDIQMPVMDGIDASREIRIYEKQKALPRSVIVALTALGSADAKEAAIDSGIDFFFTKPVSIKKLREIVTKFYT